MRLLNSITSLCAGCENPDSGVGIYACDPDAYTVFAPVLDRVIKDYHKVDSLNHPTPDFGKDKVDFANLDPSGEMIISTRVRVGRTHKDFGFPPVLTKEVGSSALPPPCAHQGGRLFCTPSPLCSPRR